MATVLLLLCLLFFMIAAGNDEELIWGVLAFGCWVCFVGVTH